MLLLLLLLHTIELWVKLVYCKPVYLLSTTISRGWFDAASILLMQVEAGRQTGSCRENDEQLLIYGEAYQVLVFSFPSSSFLFFPFLFFLLWSV